MKDMYYLQAMKALLNKNNENSVKVYTELTNKIGDKVAELLMVNSYNLIITSSQTGFITLDKEGKPTPIGVCNREHSLTIDSDTYKDCDYFANLVYEEIISHITDKENQIITLYNAFLNKAVANINANGFITMYDIIDTNKCNSIFNEFANKEE